jgi:type I restriction enzyme S subunit
MTEKIEFFRGEDKEFKDTEIGRIPKDWRVVRVGEIVECVKGKKPEEMTDEYEENYLPYLSTEFLRENKVTKLVKNSKDVVLVNDGDLILLWDGSNAGEFFLGKRGVLSSTMVKFELREKTYNQKFLFYLLKMKEDYLKNQTKGTGIPHVDGSVLSNIIIPRPSLEEQQKIASVLSTIDQAIRKTDEITSKLQELKKGLMQRLLTRGIGHTRFKRTEIGEIPEEWEVVKLGDILTLEYGAGLTERQRKNGPYPVYGSNGIVGFHDQFLVEGPGIIVGRKGTISGVIWSDANFWPIDTTYYVRLKTKLNFRWLFYKLISLNLRKLNMATGVPGLNRNLVYDQLIGLPNETEQNAIVRILDSVGQEVTNEEKVSSALIKTKRWFMDNLLTGKIRIKVS